MAPTNDEVLEALRAVEEPLLERNLVDLGLVEATEVRRGGRIVVSIAEPVEGYPYADELRQAISASVGALDGVKDVQVDIPGFQLASGVELWRLMHQR